MSTYEVKYTTTEKPENLPANASVEKLSALPAKVATGGGTVGVRRRSSFLGHKVAAELSLKGTTQPAELYREGRTVGLDEAQCRELAEALVAAADEFKVEREKATADAEATRRREAARRLDFALRNNPFNNRPF